MNRNFTAGLLVIGWMGWGAGMVCGQNYPVKPIRMIAAAQGSGNDIATRLIALGVSDSLGQQMIVENRGGMSAIETGLNAPPDGYTLLVQGSSLWLLPFMQTVSYDPVRDFAPVTLAFNSPNVIVVHPSLPVKSVRELITLARARPGALNYSSATTGTSSHLAGELFKATAGVNIVNIPYKGVGPALNDLIAGHVQLSFGSVGSVAPHMKSGRVRALAVASAQPSALLQGLPTAAASGLPGFESSSIGGIFAPLKTPVPVVNRLNQEIGGFLRGAEAKEKLANTGLEPGGGTPEQLTALIRSEMTRMGKVIRDAGIRAD